MRNGAWFFLGVGGWAGIRGQISLGCPSGHGTPHSARGRRLQRLRRDKFARLLHQFHVTAQRAALIEAKRGQQPRGDNVPPPPPIYLTTRIGR